MHRCHPSHSKYYRCEPTFEDVNEWLRKHGVNGGKPLHTLRKEYGSLLTRSYGIHAASRALRHADLRTTSEHYSDLTARVTPGIGRLVANPKRIKRFRKIQHRNRRCACEKKTTEAIDGPLAFGACRQRGVLNVGHGLGHSALSIRKDPY